MTAALSTLFQPTAAATPSGAPSTPRVDSLVIDRFDDLALLEEFGLAKRLDTADGLTKSGTILGTPGYMAPEQADGRTVGPAADVYALGAILYACLTGRPPFLCADVWETIRQVIHTDPVPPRLIN